MEEDPSRLRHPNDAPCLDDLLGSTLEDDNFIITRHISNLPARQPHNSQVPANCRVMQVNSTLVTTCGDGPTTATLLYSTGSLSQQHPMQNGFASVPPSQVTPQSRGLQQLLSSDQSNPTGSVQINSRNIRYIATSQPQPSLLVATSAPGTVHLQTANMVSTCVASQQQQQTCVIQQQTGVNVNPTPMNGQMLKHIVVQPNRYVISQSAVSASQSNEPSNPNTGAFISNQAQQHSAGPTIQPNGVYATMPANVIQQSTINGPFVASAVATNQMQGSTRMISMSGVSASLHMSSQPSVAQSAAFSNPSVVQSMQYSTQAAHPLAQTQQVGQSMNNSFQFDGHKKNLIQRQLMLLLHATKCKNQLSCSTMHCETMRGVLAHMGTCQDGKNCGYPHCASSKQIISHWKSCMDLQCNVCEPLKRQSANANASAASQNNINNPSVSGFAGNDTNLHGVNGNIRPILNTQQQQPGISGLDNSRASTNNAPLEQQQPVIEPETDWRASVSKGQRQHLVRRIVQTIFPTPDKTSYDDNRMQSLIEYATRVENENYMNAKGREEYFHKLAERCYKINKDLEEKKRSRPQLAGNQIPDIPGLGLTNTSFSTQPSSGNFSSPTSMSNRPGSIVTDAYVNPTDSTDQTTTEIICATNNDTDMANGPSMRGGANCLNSMLSGNESAQNISNPEVIHETVTSEQDHLTQFDQALKHYSTMPALKKENTDSSTPAPSISIKSEATSSEDVSIASTSSMPSSIGPSSSVGSSSVLSKPAQQTSYPFVKKWSREELCRNLLALHRLIRAQEEAKPFLEPVDPDLLGIPDYFKIIKKPMDLRTIEENLEAGNYQDPWEVIDDFWLMFSNAWLYNKKNSRVYKWCSKLAETFEKHVDKYMQCMGMCCGQDYFFLPQLLYCMTNSMCTINRDASYYYYEKRNEKDYSIFPEKYYVCEKCFSEDTKTVAVFPDLNQDPVHLQKELFELRKNNIKEREKFVHCRECGRKWHQICALHMDEIWQEGFICPTCYSERPSPGTTVPRRRRENPFSAKKLPNTKLGAFLEKRVNDFLKKKDSGAGEVTIRVLYSGEKVVEVKPLMKARFCESGSLAEQFPYLNKAIFAFQEIDGVDVCFFGLHVQEYGSNCPRPNQRRVYVSYLDSVFFFRPKQYRTDVYHEILVGYLQYVKYLGYAMAHIWACPPSEGDDYIFHMHPPEQKIPKPKRLQEWYQKMLEKALIERIVVDYRDIFNDSMRNCIDSPSEIPYFEGDFWSNSLEDLIKEVDEIKAKRAQEEECKMEDNEEEEDADDDNYTSTGESRRSGNASKKKAKKRKGNKRPAGVSAKRKKPFDKNIPAQEDSEILLNKVYEVMEKHKDVFFNIRLHPHQNEASLQPIHDPDPFISSELMDGRDNFLVMARERHLEFSSLRRAKFSSIAMLYEMHNEQRAAFMYSCNVCSAQLHARWHCKTCVEFDLCEKCYSREKHPHPLEYIQGIKLGGGSEEVEQSTPTSDLSVQEARRLSIERCIKSLTHACQCRDANCRVNACQKMKNVLIHMRNCDRKANGTCGLCKQLIALCCYHAKYCNETVCNMPFCQNIKYRWRQQQIQQRFMQAQNLRRRIANMQRDPSGVSIVSAASAHPTTSSGPSSSQTSLHPENQPSSSTSFPIVSQSRVVPVSNPTPTMHHVAATPVTSLTQHSTVYQPPRPPASQTQPSCGYQGNIISPQVQPTAVVIPQQSRIVAQHPGTVHVRPSVAGQSLPPSSSSNLINPANGYSNPPNIMANGPQNYTHIQQQISQPGQSQPSAMMDSADVLLKKRLLQEKINQIRRENPSQQEQNRKFQEFLSTHSEFIPVFRQMRDEQQQKRKQQVGNVQVGMVSMQSSVPQAQMQQSGGAPFLNGPTNNAGVGFHPSQPTTVIRTTYAPLPNNSTLIPQQQPPRMVVRPYSNVNSTDKSLPGGNSGKPPNAF